MAEKEPTVIEPNERNEQRADGIGEAEQLGDGLEVNLTSGLGSSPVNHCPSMDQVDVDMVPCTYMGTDIEPSRENKTVIINLPLLMGLGLMKDGLPTSQYQVFPKPIPRLMMH